MYTLTKGIRTNIERHVRVAGGISKSEARLLLDHIDRLDMLLEEVMGGGPDWTETEWATFIDAALPLLDGWTIKSPRLPPHVSPCRGQLYRDDWCTAHGAKWEIEDPVCTRAPMGVT